MARLRLKTAIVDIGLLIAIYLAVVGYGLLTLLVGGSRGIFKCFKGKSSGR